MIVELRDVAPWASVILSLVALWYAVRKDKTTETDEKLKTVDMRFGNLVAQNDMLKGKVSAIEGEIKHLPDSAVTHRLEIAIGKMEAEMGKLSEQVKPIAHMANRMQEAILEKVMG